MNIKSRKQMKINKNFFIVNSLLILLMTSKHFATLTYTKDIYPIFKNRCSLCHNDNWADHNWLNYDIAYKNREKIKNRVWIKRDMPASGTISDKEREMVKDWVDEGAKK